MKVKKILSAVILLSIVFILTGEPANKASPQNTNLISSSINDAFKILWENRKQAKADSVTVDVIISNLTGTWFQVELEFNPSQHNVVVGEDKIPYVFLMGPYQKKTFKNIEFFDTQVLQFDARRDVEKAPAAFAMLSIDMICRGIFSADFSPEQFKDLLFNTSIVGFEVAGDALKNDTAASLIACITAMAAGKTEEAIESFARFVFSLKESKKQIWQLIKAIYGEKDSILNTANAARVLGDIINLIEVPEKLNRMTILANATFNAPTDDQFWLTAKSNLPKLPQVKIASSLRFTPAGSTYYVDDIITADFGLDNDGSKTITLKQVLVGGRGPGGDNIVCDFTPKKDIVLDLNICYQYQGTLKVTKTGKYHFFCFYQTQDGQSNPSINLGSGLTDADRIKDIEVIQLSVSISFKTGDKVKVIPILGLWLRSSSEIINEESKNKVIPSPMPLNTELTIVNHQDNGIANDGYYWWLVQYQKQQGWCAEADYRRTNTFLSLIPAIVPLGKPGKPRHTD